MLVDTQNDSSLKVLLWSARGSGLHYGGPGMTAYRLFRNAPPDRLKIELAHGYPAQAEYDLFDQNHLIYPLDSKNPIGLCGNWKQYCFLRSADEWVRQHIKHYDVFYGLQGFDLTVRPAVVAEEMGTPAVIKLAASYSDFVDKPGWRRLLGRPKQRRKLSQRLSAIVAISQEIRQELISYGFNESKIHLIPNGVDIDEFVPADHTSRLAWREKLNWPDRRTILFSGTLVPRKRPHLLVQALGQLRQRGIDAQLVLAGPETDPNYSEQLREMARTAGVTDQVIWTGFHSQVAPLYQAADVFALPSAKEGMPNALLEAMATGLPTLATDISGSRDLIDDGRNGLISEPTADDVAGKLILLLDESASRLGTEARDTVLQSYSTKVVLQQYLQLFDRLRAGH